MRVVHFHDETLEIQRCYTVRDSREIYEKEDTPSYANDTGSSPRVGKYKSPKADNSPLDQQGPEDQVLPEIAQLQDAHILPPESLQGHEELQLISSLQDVETPTLSSQSILLNEREAILMRNFIDNMALWVCRAIFPQNDYG